MYCIYFNLRITFQLSFIYKNFDVFFLLTILSLFWADPKLEIVAAS